MYNSFLIFTKYHEKNLSTQQFKKKKNAWFSGADGHKSWKGSYFQKKKKGKKSTLSLIGGSHQTHLQFKII